MATEREIKFRAWNHMTEDWEEDSFNADLDETPTGTQKSFYVVNTMYDHGNNGSLYTYQLATGITDTTGKEIFEGDIIKTLNGQIKAAVVVFNQAAFWYKYNDEMYGEQHEEICHWVSNRVAVEIIGNVFENEELVELAAKAGGF